MPSPAELVAEGRRLAAQDKNTSALAAFEQAIALDRAFAPAWMAKALLLEDLERLDEALACYDVLSHLDAGDTALHIAIWSNRAGLLAQSGDLAAARDALDRALALDPASHVLQANRQQLTAALESTV